MAEESFIACTKELEVLKRNASKIHRSISDHRLLSMDLLSANLISLPTLNKLNAPVSTPDAQSYELINNLLQAVVCDPSNFHKLLGVLENHPPLLTAVAKEMKEDYEYCEASPAKQSESTNDQQKEIIIADGRSMQRSYDRMLGKLAGLVFDFQKIVEKANINIEDLKQYVILYHPEKKYKDELRKARDINEIFDVIRSKFCSLFNYTVLLRIAEKFNLADGFKVIEDYEAEEENYRKLLSSSTLASELQKENELLRQNLVHTKTIVLKLQRWPRPPAPTVVEFLEIIKDVFADLGDVIHLLKVEPGSIIATMIAPERAIGALIVLAKMKIAYLKDIGVTWLVIGGIIIISDIEEPSDDVADYDKLSFFSPKLENNSDDNIQISTAVGEDVGDAPPPIPVRISKRSSRTETVPDGSPPVTPTSSAVPLSECGWYWQNLSKEEVTAKFKDAPEGSFLVRNSQRGAYTLIIKKRGQKKLIRIIHLNGMYGFSDSTQFRSVPELIDYYREISLSEYNSKLDVKLIYPISRFAKISDEGVREDEDKENDVEELLENLRNVTKLFDSRIEVYCDLEKKSEIMKKEIETTHATVNGHCNVIELLREQLEILGKHVNLDGSEMENKDRKNVMENAKLLGDRITAAESSHRTSVQQLRDCNSKFRALDRVLNILRPELMRLQWKKDQYTSKLVQEGLSHHEISEKVRDEAANESESTYVELYGALEEQDKDEEDDDIYKPPPVTHHPEPAPLPPPRSTLRSSDSTQTDLSLHEREEAMYELDSYVKLVKWQNENEEDYESSSEIVPPPPPRDKSLSSPSSPKHSERQTIPPVAPPIGITPVPPPQHNRPETSEDDCELSPEIVLPRPPPYPPPPRSRSLSSPSSPKHRIIPQIVPPIGITSVPPRQHNRPETWYVECDRAHAEMHLRGKQNGTFLCRPSGKAVPAIGGIHTHTIDIVYNGIKHLKVVEDNNKYYGFSVPCSYNSLQDLILYYSENSLEAHNPKLTTTLAFPVFS